MKSWKTVLMTAALLPAALIAAPVSGFIWKGSVNSAFLGAKVYLLAGTNVAGTIVDSAISDSSGAYSINNVNNPTSGFRTIRAVASGYHTAFNQANASGNAQTGVNVTLTIDDSSSVITGRVLRASDSTPLVGAAVRLSGGRLDNPRDRITDSTGRYRFDSIGTSPSYNLAVSAGGYLAASQGSVSAVWNTTTNVSNIFLIRNTGTISGTVRRGDSTNFTIANAKIVFYVNGLKVDSTTSASNGNYSITLTGATYTVKASANGYRGNKGTSTRDTTMTVSGTPATLVIYLHPATGAITGHINHGAQGAIVAGNLPNARLYLERRMGTGAAYSAWILNDSTTSDALGDYAFIGLIPATGQTTPPATGTTSIVPAGNYRLLAKATGYTANFDTTQILTSATPTATLNLAYAANTTVSAPAISLAIPPVPIYFPGTKTQSEARISLVGNRLVMDLGSASNVARVVEVYDMNGALRHTVSVPAGESKLSMPSIFVKGFVFQVK